MKQAKILFVTVILAALTTTACTRTALQVLGENPDTIELTVMEIPTDAEFDKRISKLLVNVKPLTAQLRGKAAYFSPTTSEIDKAVYRSKKVQVAAKQSQKEIYESLGSLRTIKEVKSTFVPLFQKLAEVQQHQYLPEAIQKRNIFSSVDVYNGKSKDTVDVSKYAVIIETRFDAADDAIIVVSSNGESMTGDIGAMLSSKNQKNETDNLFKWMQAVVKK